MGSIMKWLYRIGTSGQTARKIASQFVELRRHNPQAPQKEILETILSARHAVLPYTPFQLARIHSALHHTTTVCAFAIAVVTVEAGCSIADTAEAYRELCEVVEEQVRKFGLE